VALAAAYVYGDNGVAWQRLKKKVANVAMCGLA